MMTIIMMLMGLGMVLGNLLSGKFSGALARCALRPPPTW
jgi:predicted MFS family arabinose efflux permease